MSPNIKRITDAEIVVFGWMVLTSQAFQEGREVPGFWPDFHRSRELFDSRLPFTDFMKIRRDQQRT